MRTIVWWGDAGGQWIQSSPQPGYPRGVVATHGGSSTNPTSQFLSCLDSSHTQVTTGSSARASGPAGGVAYCFVLAGSDLGDLGRGWCRKGGTGEGGGLRLRVWGNLERSERRGRVSDLGLGKFREDLEISPPKRYPEGKGRGYRMGWEGCCVKGLGKRLGGANVRKTDEMVFPHGFQKGGAS